MCASFEEQLAMVEIELETIIEEMKENGQERIAVPRWKLYQQAGVKIVTLRCNYGARSIQNKYDEVRYEARFGPRNEGTFLIDLSGHEEE